MASLAAAVCVGRQTRLKSKEQSKFFRRQNIHRIICKFLQIFDVVAPTPSDWTSGWRTKIYSNSIDQSHGPTDQSRSPGQSTCRIHPDLMLPTTPGRWEQEDATFGARGIATNGARTLRTGLLALLLGTKKLLVTGGALNLCDGPCGDIG